MGLNLNHYTDAYALKEIILPDGLKFRATRFSHLNDSQEFRWSQSHLNLYKEKLCQELGIAYDRDAQSFPYLISFCDVADELLMWELYGNQGRGFMLTLDYDAVRAFSDDANGDKNNPDVLQPITYANDENWFSRFTATYNQYCENRNSNDSNDLDEVCALIKRDIYEHEHETRYMRVGHNTGELFNPLTHSIEEIEFQQVAKFRDGAYGLTPFIEIVLPKSALKSITVGYSLNFEAQKEAIELLLYQRDYRNVEIFLSNINP